MSTIQQWDDEVTTKALAEMQASSPVTDFLISRLPEAVGVGGMGELCSAAIQDLLCSCIKLLTEFSSTHESTTHESRVSDSSYSSSLAWHHDRQPHRPDADKQDNGEFFWWDAAMLVENVRW